MSVLYFTHTVAPKAQNVLDFFMRNLNVFEKYANIVFQNEAVYRTRVQGACACKSWGIGACKYDLTLGDLLRLYRKPDSRWKFRKLFSDCYLISVAGSGFSGMLFHSKVWHKATGKLLSVSVPFSPVFKEVEEIKKNPPVFDGNVFVPPELQELVDALNRKTQEWEDFRKKEEQRQIRAQRINRRIDNQSDKNGVSVLMRACETGEIRTVVKIWMQQGEKPFSARTKDGRTMINFAAKNLSALKFLIRKKLPLTYYFSPVADACETKEHIVERLELLTGIGADMNARNVAGETPLDVSIAAYNPVARKWLEAKGVKQQGGCFETS